MQEPERGVPSAHPPQRAAGQSGAPVAGHAVPATSACPDLDTREGVGGDGDRVSCQLSPGPEGTAAPQSQEGSPGTLRGPPPDPQRVRSAPELVRPLRAMDGLGRDRTDRPPQVRRLPGCVCWQAGAFLGGEASGKMSPWYETGTGNS